jgi:hypothetical protein
MLHTEAVDDSTLELLKSLQSKEYLKGFFLTGGTALALYLGHRKSADIDLFSNFGFDVSQMLENINHDFQFQLLYSSTNTIRLMMHWFLRVLYTLMMLTILIGRF